MMLTIVSWRGLQRARRRCQSAERGEGEGQRLPNKRSAKDGRQLASLMTHRHQEGQAKGQKPKPPRTSTSSQSACQARQDPVELARSRWPLRSPPGSREEHRIAFELTAWTPFPTILSLKTTFQARWMLWVVPLRRRKMLGRVWCLAKSP